MGLWKNRASELGHLESEVMEIIWREGDSTVNHVASKISRPLAYTTVMTTLDRLFKKGILERRKSDRAFVYSARISQREWEQQRTDRFIAGFLNQPKNSGQALISCLVDAVGEQDRALLDELEKTIRKKRRELERRGKP
ncbi:MAG TPA: BlaI/MecI/CopY family transcriptional regulator [Bryobacteraceae bacterium]|nr:BlaI/MecI/CopY family transcriptional regulator [Bryobacteraceae bacterium]